MNSRTPRDPTLEPLRTALTTQAREVGERLRRAARDDAAASMLAARIQADAILTDAREEGLRDAAVRVSSDRARVRRDIRRRSLVAQREIYDDLVDQARAAVRALLLQGSTRQRLTDHISLRLGPTTDVLPVPGGGLVGRGAGGSRIDASVDALVQRAVDSLDLEMLWTPR